MPSISLFITATTFLVLTCALHLLSCTPIASRRILHQPLLPQNTFPPSQPPSPSPPSPQTTTTTTTTTTTPKIPFSTTTPNQSPFFPSFPSPPPPPSPASFASFPANISSLILPHSNQPKQNSQKLLIVAITAVLSAVIVASLLICFYYRRHKQNRNLTDEKTHSSYRSDNSHRPYPTNAETTRSSSHKLRTASTASSEFLYIGTLVNPRGIDDNADPRNDGVLDTRKMDSPELQPLPPLARHNGANVDEETEDEFYSPRMSLGGRESSSGTGSGSRRLFAGIAGEASFGARTDSSSCSCSSSSSGSPARSNSVSISPPVSLSPRRSEPKSPDLTEVHVPPPPPPPPPLVSSHSSLSPQTGLERSADVSDVWYRNVRSPPLSLASTSPDRTLVKEADASHVLNWNVRSPTLSSASVSPNRVSNAVDSNVRSPSLSPASLSPHRGGFEKSASASPRISNVSDPNRRSPSVFSSSPERDLKDESPRISNVSDPNRRSPSVFSSSPERGLKDESPRKSDVSNHNRRSPSVFSSSERDLKDESPRKSDVSNHNRRSPSVLSSSSSSPERDLKDESPRKSDVSDHNRRSPSVLSPSSSSPERGLKDESPRKSDVSDHNRQFPSVFSSPERDLKNESPRKSDVSNHNRRSPSVLSSSSSPERGLKDASPRRSDVSDQKVQSPVKILEQLTSPPPPPPPPPPLPPQRHWESPSPSTPIGQLFSKPPPLIPPSRPFVIQNTTKVSPIELPPSSKAVENVEETPKLKLKPLHWDKVRASSDREMVWDHLRSSSFKLNEEMIETLFVVNNPTPQQKQATPRSVLPSPNQENRVLDPKKSQNIAISLRALNMTIEEVCEALLEGNADTLGTEVLESLLKMAPTKEEERKLKEYKDDSPTKLGPAEKFLKAMLDVPFAFKRVDAMLYIANFESEIEYLKRSFETLETACEELRSSRMFLKLLEAVLKTGNRMNVGTNRGDAHAFKLDTLLKLVDVKGADGKTTLLHFVVQEIIRTEGARISGTNQNPSSTLNEDARCRKLGLQVVSGLSLELTNVKKSAAMDSDVLSSDVSKLSRGIENISDVVRLNETMGSDGSSQKFSESMNRFMRMAEEEIIRIQAQESVALSLVKEITEYFHGNSAREEAHPFRIFMVVRDFLAILDRVCKEVGMINERTIVSSAHKFPVPVNPMMPQVFPVPVNPTMPQAFPGFQGRRQYSSSDDES